MEKAVIIQAESDFHYAVDSAVNECHERLEQKVREYMTTQSFEDADIVLGPIEESIEHEVFVDEYQCTCKRKVTMRP